MEPPELGVKIAREIAAEKGVKPATLDPPVQAVVDVTALEKLIYARPHARTEFSGVVVFTYEDYTVTVDQTGTVSITASSEPKPETDDRCYPDDSFDTPSDPH